MVQAVQAGRQEYHEEGHRLSATKESDNESMAARLLPVWLYEPWIRFPSLPRHELHQREAIHMTFRTRRCDCSDCCGEAHACLCVAVPCLTEQSFADHTPRPNIKTRSTQARGRPLHEPGGPSYKCPERLRTLQPSESISLRIVASCPYIESGLAAFCLGSPSQGYTTSGYSGSAESRKVSLTSKAARPPKELG